MVNFVIHSRPLILAFVLISALFIFFWDQNLTSPLNALTPKPSRNYAYTTFLASPWDIEKNATDDEDHYFTQTRMLLYQLRYDPVTRSPNGYPFVVLVTEDVPKSKRERLQREGAIVKEIAKLKGLQHETRKAWKDVLTKLRLFEMVEYERIAFFDSDHILTRPVDDIFDDPAAAPQQNKHLANKDAVKPDEAPQPDTYIFASNAGSGSYDHPLPPPMGNNLNAGILVFKPCIELYNYHLSLTMPEAEKRYNGRYPEQGLWSYAHRRDGNMPWMQLDWKWNINHAVYADIEAGIASVHTKYWELDHDTKLRDIAMSIKWRMEGFWTRVHATRG